MRKLLVIIAAVVAISPLFADLPQKHLTIHAVGDIMMGTLYPHQILPPKNGKDIFLDVEPYLKAESPDLVLGNLEGALCDYPHTSKRVSAGRVYAFRMPPHYALYLKAAGFTVLSFANNHSNDFGYKGSRETRNYIKAAGIDIFGDKGEILYLEKNGIKIALIAYSYLGGHNSILDLPAARSLIAKAKANSDIVVLSVHGGAEGEGAMRVVNKMEYMLGEPRGNMVGFSRGAIDAGADLILGHGPHIPRAMEIYKNRLIAYSLGNFLTYTMSTSGNKKVTLILRVSLKENGEFASGRIIPLIQHSGGILNGIPYFDKNAVAVKLIKKLSREDIPGNLLEITEDGQLIKK